MLWTELRKPGGCTKIITIIYVKMIEGADNSAMIQNYFEIMKNCKFVWSILEFSCTCNYIPDDSYQTT